MAWVFLGVFTAYYVGLALALARRKQVVDRGSVAYRRARAGVLTIAFGLPVAVAIIMVALLRR